MQHIVTGLFGSAITLLIIILGGITVCHAQQQESVKVDQVQMVTVKECIKKENLDATQSIATISGAAVGAYAGSKIVGGNLGKIGGAMAGGAIGYNATNENCLQKTKYNVFYTRYNGRQGSVVMEHPPSATKVLVTFCGDLPCH